MQARSDAAITIQAERAVTSSKINNFTKKQKRERDNLIEEAINVRQMYQKREEELELDNKREAQKVRDDTNQLQHDNHVSIQLLKSQYNEKEDKYFNKEKDLKRKHSDTIIRKNVQLKNVK